MTSSNNLFFTDQVLHNGLFVNGNINTNFVNKSNIVIEPKKLRGAYINKYLFTKEEAAHDAEMVKRLNAIHDEMAEILKEIVEIGEKFNIKQAYDIVHELKIIQEKRKLEEKFDRIDNSEHIVDIENEAIAEVRRDRTEREKKANEEKYYQEIRSVETNIQKVEEFQGFSKANYYIGLHHANPEEFKEVSAFFKNSIAPMFISTQTSYFKNYIKDDKLYEVVINLKDALDKETYSKIEKDLRDKKNQLETEFENFKKQKVEDFKAELIRRQGGTHNATSQNISKIEYNVELKREDMVNRPYKEFESRLEAERHNKIQTLLKEVESKLKDINKKYIDKIREHNANEIDSGIEQRNQALDRKRAADKEAEKRNTYTPTSGNGKYTAIQNEENEKLNNIIKNKHQKKYEKNNSLTIEMAEASRKERESYEAALGDLPYRLRKTSESYKDVYDSSIEVENHVHQGLADDFLTTLEHTALRVWDTQKVNDSEHGGEFIPETGEYFENLNKNHLDQTFDRIGKVLKSKYIYELNSYINSIYEENDKEGKLNSEIWIDVPELEIVADEQEFLDYNGSMKPLEQNEEGLFKVHKGFHKILTIDEESMTALIYEWTGKFPTVSIFIPDPTFITMIQLYTQKKMFEKYDIESGENKIKNDPEKYTYKVYEDGKDIIKLINPYEYKSLLDDNKDEEAMFNFIKNYKNELTTDLEYLGNNKDYINALEKVKELFTNLLVDQHIRMKQEEALFLDPFHLDEEERPLELKGTVGFISDDDIRFIRNNEQYKNAYRASISGGIEDGESIDKSELSNVKKVYGLEYGQNENIEIEELKVKNENNIVYDAMPNGWSVLKDVEYNSRKAPGNKIKFDPKKNIDTDDYLSKYKPLKKTETKIEKSFFGFKSKEVEIETSVRDMKWYYDKNMIAQSYAIPYGSTALSYSLIMDKHIDKVDNKSLVNQERYDKVSNMKEELKEIGKEVKDREIN